MMGYKSTGILRAWIKTNPTRNRNVPRSFLLAISSFSHPLATSRQNNYYYSARAKEEEEENDRLRIEFGYWSMPRQHTQLHQIAYLIPTGI